MKQNRIRTNTKEKDKKQNTCILQKLKSYLNLAIIIYNILKNSKQYLIFSYSIIRVSTHLVKNRVDLV